MSEQIEESCVHYFYKLPKTKTNFFFILSVIIFTFLGLAIDFRISEVVALVPNNKSKMFFQETYFIK